MDSNNVTKVIEDFKLLSDSEKANELIGLLKNKKLSLKELKELVPVTTEFITKFSEVISKEIDNDAKSYEKFHATIQSSLNVLNGIIIDKDITHEERMLAHQTMMKIIDKIADVQKNRDNNSTKFKAFLSTLGTFLLGIIVILASGRNGRNNKNFS